LGFKRGKSGQLKDTLVRMKVRWSIEAWRFFSLQNSIKKLVFPLARNFKGMLNLSHINLCTIGVLGSPFREKSIQAISPYRARIVFGLISLRGSQPPPKQKKPSSTRLWGGSRPWCARRSWGRLVYFFASK
jgi:hypothetical protein